MAFKAMIKKHQALVKLNSIQDTSNIRKTNNGRAAAVPTGEKKVDHEMMQFSKYVSRIFA